MAAKLSSPFIRAHRVINGTTVRFYEGTMKYILFLLLLIFTAFRVAEVLYPYTPDITQPTVYAVIPQNTPTPSPTPALSQIVAEIAKVFEPEGKHIVVRAINCFYAESGLRHDALHVNNNGTTDGGVAQINSIWKMTNEDRFNYKQNIQKAYEIYQRRGNFSAWYAPGCND